MGSTLYVSAKGDVSRLVVSGQRVVSRKQIVTRLPFGRHQQDTIALGPDGRLYLGSGSTCDVCREQDRRSGAILSFELDGSDVRIVATGLRNPFGLVFDGATLYVSDKRATTSARRSRPRRSSGSSPAPTTGGRAAGRAGGTGGCRARAVGVTPPVAYLEPHSSADSLALWAGTMIVAEWGQYLSERWGRKLVQVNLGPAAPRRSPTASSTRSAWPSSHTAACLPATGAAA